MLFVSTNCLNQPTRKAIACLLGEGISNIELGPSQECDEGIEEFLISIKNARFIIHNYFPPPKKPFILNLASSDKQVREMSLAQARKSINLCTRLQSRLYSVHAGFVTDPAFGANHFNFSAVRKGNDYKPAFNRFVNSLKELLNFAAPAGIKIAIENNICVETSRGHLLLSVAQEFERLFCELPSPNLGVNLDLGHLNVSARTLGFDKADFIRRIKNRIFAVHVHQNNGESDSHQPLKEKSWALYALEKEQLNEKIPIVLEAHNLTLEDVLSQLRLIGERVKVC